jgi:hypothetical protein
MAHFADTFGASLDAVVSATEQIASQSAAALELTSKALIAAQSAIAEAHRYLDATASMIAGEIASRSRPEAGHAGLAQQEGFRTAEALVQHATGSTAREAATLVRVGAMIRDSMIQGLILQDSTAASTDETGAPAHPVAEPWLVPVGAAVASGTLSVAAAEAIRGGLGVPNEAVSIEGSGMPRRWRKPDGMTCYTWLLDPEAAALVDGIYDQLPPRAAVDPEWSTKPNSNAPKHSNRTPAALCPLSSTPTVKRLTWAGNSDSSPDDNASA